MTTHADRDRSEPYWPPAAAAAYDEPVPDVPTEPQTGLPEYLDAIHAGADATPVPENAWPTAGQLWHQLLTSATEDRLDRLGRLIDAMAENFQRFGPVPTGPMQQRLTDAIARDGASAAFRAEAAQLRAPE